MIIKKIVIERYSTLPVQYYSYRMFTIIKPVSQHWIVCQRCIRANHNCIYGMPDFMDQYSAMQVKHLHESGISGAALDEALKSIESSNYNYKNNPFFFAMYTYMEILPVGILITLISALILRKKAPSHIM